MVSSSDLSALRIAREPRGSPLPRSWRRLVIPLVAVVAVIAIGAAVVLLRDSSIPVQVAQAVMRGGAAGGGGGLTANGYVLARTKASVSSKVPEESGNGEIRI